MRKLRCFGGKQVTQNLRVHEWQVGFEPVAGLQNLSSKTLDWLEPLGPDKCGLWNKESCEKRHHYDPMLRNKLIENEMASPSLHSPYCFPSFMFFPSTYPLLHPPSPQCAVCSSSVFPPLECQPQESIRLLRSSLFCVSSTQMVYWWPVDPGELFVEWMNEHTTLTLTLKAFSH